MRAATPTTTTTTPTTIRTFLLVSDAPATWVIARPCDWTAICWYFDNSAGLSVTFLATTVGAVNEGELDLISEASEDTAVEINITTAINFEDGLCMGSWG